MSHKGPLIALDTETTGLKHQAGHRIIEIGCRKLHADDHFHVYVNPHRDIDQAAIDVHGISNEFLQDKPDFSQICAEFLAYISGATLIIHNAPFDVGFLNMELKRAGYEKELGDYSTIIDTLVLARKKYPGQRYYNLNALCKQFGISNAHRTLHGALIDASLLAEVYSALQKEQTTLFANDVSGAANIDDAELDELMLESLRVLHATDEELTMHRDFIAGMLKQEKAQ